MIQRIAPPPGLPVTVQLSKNIINIFKWHLLRFNDDSSGFGGYNRKPEESLCPCIIFFYKEITFRFYPGR